MSPTFKSFRVAGDPLFSNLVCSANSTVTDCLEVVSTVMELSEILVTLPMRCFSFPCARAKTERAKYQVTTAMARFILLLSNCDALWFGWRIAWLIFVQKLFFFL